MNMRFNTFILVILLAPLTVAAERLPAPIHRELNRTGLDEQRVGIFVQEVNAKAPLLSHAADHPFNPASTMKLVTTYAGLELLGPAYTWKTEFYANGTLQDGVLNGDLIIKGYGNPKLTLENFWLMLRELRLRGVSEIRGDLVLDRGFFRIDDDPARFDNEPLRPYNVAPDALLLNFNSVRLQFIPDAEKKTVLVTAEPKPAQLEIANNLILTDEACGEWKAKELSDIQVTPQAARIVLNGSYPLGCGEQTWNVALLSHPQYVFGVFKDLWQELGGKLKGTLREADTPAEARLIFSGVSETLGEAIRDINKWSNNVMARLLFLTIGAESSHMPAAVEYSVSAISQWLTEKNLLFPELVLENGAGLSRRERISARHMGQLLLAAYKSPLMPELIASLPLAGVDGTMKKRLISTDVSGRAHIKTGSLEGVKAIAGYVLDDKGRTVVVVCFINHPHAGDSEPFLDSLLQWVHQRR
jgi:D-alanyl-D-alanine carboxypeptidase/D-alanyl-D-alanine-endopeptidase (penicillin-binding protein 4)